MRSIIRRTSPAAWIVAEVAAFMLENCTTFRAQRRRADEHHRGPPRSVRHDGALRRDEGPDLGLAAPGDLAIANAADPWVMTETARHRVAALHVRLAARRDAPRRGAFLDGKRASCCACRDEERYPIDDLVIVGNHNMENAMCAYLATRARRPAARRRPRRRARVPPAAAPHGARRRSRQHLLLRRQQGHERRVGRGVACAASRGRSC